MSSTFTGFSEEDLKRIKSAESVPKSGPEFNISNIKKLDRIGIKPKRVINQYKLPILKKQDSDDAIDSIFDKCKLTIKTPTSPVNTSDNEGSDDKIENLNENVINGTQIEDNTHIQNNNPVESDEISISIDISSKKKSTDVAPDIVRGVEDYTEDELMARRAKLEELQYKQKLMEEQNKKRKEVLAKALADRTRQTEEEVMKLEKIKKELQVLDGQFSQDVAVLRKKIDQACLNYSEAEKHYLRVEKEFLQAKINLQKEKEKKELLTEHLCTLITHNETRKAQKLEKLMVELASKKKNDIKDAQVLDEDNKVVEEVDKETGKNETLVN